MYDLEQASFTCRNEYDAIENWSEKCVKTVLKKVAKEIVGNEKVVLYKTVYVWKGFFRLFAA